MENLLTEVRSCEICKAHLPNPPKPIVQASEASKIVIIGQAPGQKVQNSGVPWDDPSGKELRRWLGVTEDTFYDPDQIALLPMGFCYPGKGKSGDLPPRPECAPQWHHEILSGMTNIQITLLIGQYAQRYYLGDSFKSNITENVRSFRDFWPKHLPLVHPSPRNRIWQRKNPWFEEEVVPQLQQVVSKILKP